MSKLNVFNRKMRKFYLVWIIALILLIPLIMWYGIDKYGFYNQENFLSFVFFPLLITVFIYYMIFMLHNIEITPELIKVNLFKKSIITESLNNVTFYDLGEREHDICLILMEINNKPYKMVLTNNKYREFQLFTKENNIKLVSHEDYIDKQEKDDLKIEHQGLNEFIIKTPDVLDIVNLATMTILGIMFISVVQMGFYSKVSIFTFIVFPIMIMCALYRYRYLLHSFDMSGENVKVFIFERLVGSYSINNVLFYDMGENFNILMEINNQLYRLKMRRKEKLRLQLFIEHNKLNLLTEKDYYIKYRN